MAGLTDRVGIYEAKTHLTRLIERVQDGATITITRHGEPVALLVPPPAAKVDYEALFRQADGISDSLAADPDGWSVQRYIEVGGR